VPRVFVYAGYAGLDVAYRGATRGLVGSWPWMAHCRHTGAPFWVLLFLLMQGAVSWSSQERKTGTHCVVDTPGCVCHNNTPRKRIVLRFASFVVRFLFSWPIQSDFLITSHQLHLSHRVKFLPTKHLGNWFTINSVHYQQSDVKFINVPWRTWTEDILRRQLPAGKANPL